ncbi:hypothetical protein MMC27_005721 [Xylographa pallens]|nr:hypothetical protein [Xylographa pallens]
MSFESAQKEPMEVPPRTSMNGLGRLVNGKWHCDCNVPARCLTTRKVGPNQGAKFWRCPRSNEDQCAFFLWVEHEAQARAWLEVSQPYIPPPTPTSTEKGVEVPHRHRSMNETSGDGPMLSQTPLNLFPTAKRKTMSDKTPNNDSDKDPRDRTLEGDEGSSQTTINADSPPRKVVRTSPRLTPTRDPPEVVERGGTSLPTPYSRDRRPATSHSLVGLRRRQLRDTSPTPGRIFIATNSITNPGEEDSDLTTRVMDLIRSDNLELKATTEMQLQHEIDLELDLSKAKMRRYENTIYTLYERLNDLEKEVESGVRRSN